MNRLTLAVMSLVLVAMAACVSASDEPTVLLESELVWEQLNPARGDQSPKAATLWGDRNGTEPTAFLVEFVDGFSSPPHIHNVSYRGVVIHGLVHNDDPDAAHMWMPPGSYWTQPKGEAHITAAKGARNVAYIEIDEGPYLVRPTEQAFDSGERPVNVDAGNIVWQDASSTSWVENDGPQVAFLWGEPRDDRPNGSLVKLPAGFSGELHGHGSLRAVVIQGQPRLHLPDETDVASLDPGSTFRSTGDTVHRLAAGDEECILYVLMHGTFAVASR